MGVTREGSSSSEGNIQPTQPTPKVVPVMYIKSPSGGSIKVSCPVTDTSLLNIPPAAVKTNTVQSSSRPIISSVIPGPSRVNSGSKNSLSYLTNFLKPPVPVDKNETTALLLPNKNSQISSTNLNETSNDSTAVPVAVPPASSKPNIVSFKIASGQLPSNTPGYTVVGDKNKSLSKVRAILPKQPAEVKLYPEKGEMSASIKLIKSEQGQCAQASHQTASVLTLKKNNAAGNPAQSFPTAVITPVSAPSSVGSQAISQKSGATGGAIMQTGNSNQNYITQPGVSRPISLKLGNKNFVIHSFIRNQVVSIQQSTTESGKSVPIFKTQPKIFTIHKDGNRNVLSLCSTQKKQIPNEHPQLGGTSDKASHMPLQSSANAQVNTGTINASTVNVTIKGDISSQPIVGNEIQAAEAHVPDNTVHTETVNSLKILPLHPGETKDNVTFSESLNDANISAESSAKELPNTDIHCNIIPVNAAENVKYVSDDSLNNGIPVSTLIDNTIVGKEIYQPNVADGSKSIEAAPLTSQYCVAGNERSIPADKIGNEIYRPAVPGGSKTIGAAPLTSQYCVTGNERNIPADKIGNEIYRPNVIGGSKTIGAAPLTSQYCVTGNERNIPADKIGNEIYRPNVIGGSKTIGAAPLTSQYCVTGNERNILADKIGNEIYRPNVIGGSKTIGAAPLTSQYCVTGNERNILADKIGNEIYRPNVIGGSKTIGAAPLTSQYCVTGNERNILADKIGNEIYRPNVIGNRQTIGAAPLTSQYCVTGNERNIKNKIDRNDAFYFEPGMAEGKANQMSNNSAMIFENDKGATAAEAEKLKLSDDEVKTANVFDEEAKKAKALEEVVVAARTAAYLKVEHGKRFAFNPKDFDPLKSLKWKNGIGSLPGSNLKFRVNECGLLEMLEECNYENVIKKRRPRKANLEMEKKIVEKEKEKPENQNYKKEKDRKSRRKEPVTLKPNLASYSAGSKKSKNGKGADEFLCCDFCGCYGDASEFYNSRFCSVKCKSVFRVKNDPKKDIFDTGDDTPLTYRKRRRKFFQIMQQQLVLSAAVIETIKSTINIIEEIFLSSEVRVFSKKYLYIKTSGKHKQKNAIQDVAKDDTTDVAKDAVPNAASDDSSKSQPKNTKPPWMTGKSGFSWTKYLDHFKAKAAPEKLFKDAFPFSRNNFKVGMKLEAIDPQNPKFISVVTVTHIHGYRIELHFDGYSDVFNFWVNADSLDIFPPGWCEKNHRELLPPHGYTAESFNWYTYLKQCRAPSAPKNLFANKFVDAVCPTGFRLGMKLEAVNMKNMRLVCVATVADLLDNRILVHLDGWSDIYDYWADVTSPYIHPVGWCEEQNRRLNPPKGFKNPESFTWEKYLKLTNSIAAPSRAFKQRPACGFYEGMKLEAVDPRVPAFIRVATVVDVVDHRLQISFDGWSHDYDFWIDDHSTDIHPVGWCGKTDHILELPPISEDIKRTKCPILVCCGAGHANDMKLKSHFTAEDCPYSPQNMRKRISRRLGHRRETEDELNLENNKEEKDDDIVKSDSDDLVVPNTRKSRKRHITDDNESECETKKRKQNLSRQSEPADKEDEVFKEPAPVPRRKKKLVQKETPKESPKGKPEFDFVPRRLRGLQADKKETENDVDSINFSEDSSTKSSTPPPVEIPEEDTVDISDTECQNVEDTDPSVDDPDIIKLELKEAILNPGSNWDPENDIPYLSPRLIEEVSWKLMNPRTVNDPRMWSTWGLMNHFLNIPGCEEIARLIDEKNIDGKEFIQLTQDQMKAKFGWKFGTVVKAHSCVVLLKKKYCIE